MGFMSSYYLSWFGVCVVFPILILSGREFTSIQQGRLIAKLDLNFMQAGRSLFKSSGPSQIWLLPNYLKTLDNERDTDISCKRNGHHSQKFTLGGTCGAHLVQNMTCVALVALVVCGTLALGLALFALVKCPVGGANTSKHVQTTNRSAKTLSLSPVATDICKSTSLHLPISLHFQPHSVKHHAAAGQADPAPTLQTKGTHFASAVNAKPGLQLAHWFLRLRWLCDRHVLHEGPPSGRFQTSFPAGD